MNLLKSFSIYTLTSFLVAGIPFLLLPVITHYLTPEDYGVLSLLNSITRFAIPFVTIGGVYAISLEYFKKEKLDFRNYFSSVWFLQFSAFLVVLALFILLGAVLGEALSLPYLWLLLIPFLGLFSISEEIALVILRNEDKAVTYGVLRITKVVIEISLTLFFIIGLSLNWKGRILSSAIVASFFFIGAVCFFYKKNLLQIKQVNRKDILLALSFGLPLIPDQLGSFLLNISDRFFIVKMESLAEVGIYSIGSQIGMVVLILCQAFFLGFSPFQFKSMKEGSMEAKIKIVQISIGFMFVLT